jgi:hypothetical protein
VTAQATVATIFAGAIGINSFSVSATSTAARTVSSKPLDIALVLDRTGSMAGELGNLQAGVTSFLNGLNPALDRVALLLLPPIPKGGNACSSVSASSVNNDWYPLGSDNSYLAAPLTSSFATIESDVRCMSAGGSTSYRQALIAAETMLTQNARPGAQKVIVFETDGAANTVPDSDYAQPDSFLSIGGNSYVVTGKQASAASGVDIATPCGSAVTYAASIAATTAIYTVGYELSGDDTCYQAPHLAAMGRGSTAGYRDVMESGTTAESALSEIASETSGQYFEQENGSQLDQTFAAVASDFASPELVPDSS